MTHQTNQPDGFGVATWSAPEWLDLALAWIDERLAAMGSRRTGGPGELRVRPWSAVFRLETTSGLVWMKASSPATAFEVGLHAILARAAPERVLQPIALDATQAWMLLPDGGTSIGERLSGTDLANAFVEGLNEYGGLQRRLESHVDEMLAAGVSDMRPDRMPERFPEALDAVERGFASGDGSPGAAILDTVAGLENDFGDWCAELASSPFAPSLDHNDLHPWNVIGGGGDSIRFYDWGDAVVAHPLAVMLVPLGVIERELADEGSKTLVRRARDAYLEAYTDVAPRAELERTLALATRVAKIARCLTWERALRTARDQGEEIDASWASGPLENLAAVAEPGWSGGG